jgi:imidazolonepropionase-like amidohydrolase
MGWTRELTPQRFWALPAALVASVALGAWAPTPDARTLALVGGLIRTQTDAGDFVGTLVVRDGKIAALGPNVAVPADARRIDAAGHVITPGLIDAHGVLGLNPAAAREGGRDAGLNILDAVDPFAEDWRDAARQGVTAVYVQPSNSGSLGGNGAVLRVGPAASAEDLALRPIAGVQATLGVAAAAAPTPAPTANNPLAAQAQTPVGSNALTRFTQSETLRSQLDAAKKYGESKPTRRDPAKDLLLQAVKREIPLRLEVGHEDDLRNALKLAADFNLRTVYEHIDRIKVLPEEFVNGKSGLVLGPLLGAKPSAEVRKLALDGRKWALGTFSTEPKASAWLRAHAAAAVAAGFPRDKVLQALTHDAAELVGVADRAGSLAVGRVADLAVFAGDPLDPSVPVRLTLCQGAVTYEGQAAEVAPPAVTAKVELPARLPPVYVLRTKRLLAPTGEWVPGELVVENGRLTGPGPVSPGVPTFDLGDAPVTPGLVAANVEFFTEDTQDADAAQLRGADGLTPDDHRLATYREGGFLTAVVAPGSRNVIAGMANALATAGANGVADCGLKFVLSSTARNAERFPGSLIGQVELINERLRGAPGRSDLYLPPAVRNALLAQRDKNLTLAREGKVPAVFEAHTRGEIQAALRLITEHKLRGVLLRPKQLDDLAGEIRAAGMAVVTGPLTPQDAEKLRTGLVELAKAGVPVGFAGDPAEARTTAAWLVNGGLPRALARRALIGQPVEKFGLPAACGRLAPGEAADFVVWEGDPVDPGCRPAAVVAQGQRVRR